MAPPSKRKKRKEDDESEESEWEGESKASTSNSDDDELGSVVEEDAALEQRPPPKKKAKMRAASNESDDELDSDVEDDDASENPPPPKKKKKKLRAVKDMEEQTDAQPDESEFLPSSARLTEFGGYAHTDTSRLKISRANRGNTPWNKGKVRSQADKDKIRAGVQARNRTLLLAKLAKLNMSEEEWIAKKREIKYIRERLRRAKRANEHRAAADAEKKLKAAIAATMERNDSEPPAAHQDEEAVVDDDESVVEMVEKVIEPAAEKVTKRVVEKVLEPVVEKVFEPVVESEAPPKAVAKKPAKQTRDSQPGRIAVGPPPDMPSLFTKDIEWTPHAFDSEQVSYADSCPEGGPGGLICCEKCASQYSDFLSATVNDIEHQKTAKLGSEMTQLLNFLSNGKARLGESTRMTRRKPPPRRRLGDALPTEKPVKPKAQTRRAATANAPAPTPAARRPRLPSEAEHVTAV